jgi:HNH endonuclease
MYSEANRRRFRDKVRVDRESDCWVWVGARHPRGYGQFSANGFKVYAHRYLFEYVNGPVPLGLELDHLCVNKSCIRPKHLEAVTHAENMCRAADRGVWDRERNGNAKLTEDNVFAIKRSHKCGVPVKEMAKRFNVSIRLIYYIIQ